MNKRQSLSYREISRKDWLATFARLLLLLLAIGVGSVLLLPTYWWLWLLLVVGLLWWLVRWHAQTFAYRCANCGRVFTIPVWVDFSSLQGISRQGEGRKYLKCPHCHSRTWASLLRIQAQ
jgi:DNA-directed RNA polymerase subunit RPC12/RpoP